MRVLDYSGPEGSDRPDALPPGTAAVLGAFDGMHLGHQALVERARARAEHVALVTFEPRPADVLAPDRASPRLQSPSQRERVCRDLGVELLVVLRFDRSVAALDPATFVERFLIAGLAPAQIVVGYDFHFGANRAGGPKLLADLLGPAGIPLTIVEQIQADGEKLGSTAIRELVGKGEVERATELLGRYFAVEGEVRHGAARGRQLGFPTANVASRNMRPGGGVYACYLTLLAPGGHHEAEHWPAVANVGSNPTFADGAATTTGLEVHALDVELGEQLYGREVEVGFVKRLRDERKFASVDDLELAIADDVAQARELFEELEAQGIDRLHARPSRGDGGTPA
ncbi:riboflavin biosynthesis protein RibF [Nannocystaceae bacterium ST9]